MITACYWYKCLLCVGHKNKEHAYLNNTLTVLEAALCFAMSCEASI